MKDENAKIYEEHMLEVLAKIAKLFNSKNINWSLGASSMLYLKGITRSFKDIDIFVNENDLLKANLILLKLGNELPIPKCDNVFSKFYGEYIIENVSVSLTSGFTIIKDKEKYFFPFNKDNEREKIVLNGEKIPLDKIEDWKEYYKLLGRNDKVEIINNYLNNY